MRRAGPVDELIAKTPDWRGAMLAKLRNVVHDADPEIADAPGGRRRNDRGRPLLLRGAFPSALTHSDCVIVSCELMAQRVVAR